MSEVNAGKFGSGKPGGLPYKNDGGARRTF